MTSINWKKYLLSAGKMLTMGFLILLGLWFTIGIIAVLILWLAD
ncbi:hypothetical protein [Paenibacillus sp. J23TS9]|nr:hypothetical protein [Paenibacillus sp. J23TS9]